MKLPLREYADVVAALKRAADSDGLETRGAARMQVSAKVEIHLLVEGKRSRSYSALTRDMSLAGMGVLQSVTLPENQDVIIALPRASGPLFVHAIVKHCRVLADGLAAVGLEYTRLADARTCAALQKRDSDELARIPQSIN